MTVHDELRTPTTGPVPAGDAPAAAAPVLLGVHRLGFDQVIDVARHGRTVDLGPDSLAAMAASRAIVETLADDVAPHYGISTGFGALATTSIPPHRRAALQTSLIRSHAAGSGEPVEREVVRALMLLRLATLARGRTDT